MHRYPNMLIYVRPLWHDVDVTGVRRFPYSGNLLIEVDMDERAHWPPNQLRSAIIGLLHSPPVRRAKAVLTPGNGAGYREREGLHSPAPRALMIGRTVTEVRVVP